MVIVTSEEINHYRSDLADDPIALRALDMIEDCEGDLDDAAIALALHVGQEPDRTEQWLDSLAKRWRVLICQTAIKEHLDAGMLADAVRLLASETAIPAILATPVVIYVLKTGTEEFCKPLQEKL
jgi:hypothetical protein